MTLLSLLLFVACLFITSYIILLRTMREQTLQMKSKKEKLEQELYDYHEAKKNGFYYITKKDFDIALQEKFEAFMRNASEDMYNQSNGMINTSVHFAKEELFKIYKSNDRGAGARHGPDGRGEAAVCGGEGVIGNTAIEYFVELEMRWKEFDPLSDDEKAALSIVCFAVTEVNALMRMYAFAEHHFTGKAAIDYGMLAQSHSLLRSWSAKLFEVSEFTGCI